MSNSERSLHRPTGKTVQVEDHDLAYADFESVLGEREYGGGTALVWDTAGLSRTVNLIRRHGE